MTIILIVIALCVFYDALFWFWIVPRDFIRKKTRFQEWRPGLGHYTLLAWYKVGRPKYTYTAEQVTNKIREYRRHAWKHGLTVKDCQTWTDKNVN